MNISTYADFTIRIREWSSLIDRSGNESWGISYGEIASAQTIKYIDLYTQEYHFEKLLGIRTLAYNYIMGDYSFLTSLHRERFSCIVGHTIRERITTRYKSTNYMQRIILAITVAILESVHWEHSIYFLLILWMLKPSRELVILTTFSFVWYISAK